VVTLNAITIAVRTWVPLPHVYILQIRDTIPSWHPIVYVFSWCAFLAFLFIANVATSSTFRAGCVARFRKPSLVAFPTSISLVQIVLWANKAFHVGPALITVFYIAKEALLEALLVCGFFIKIRTLCHAGLLLDQEVIDAVVAPFSGAVLAVLALHTLLICAGGAEIVADWFFVNDSDIWHVFNKDFEGELDSGVAV